MTIRIPTIRRGGSALAPPSARVPLASLALLAALASPAAAQEPARLTLLDAARRSLAVHPTVAGAAAGVDAARAVEAGARAAWWPSLALDASATRFEEPMPVFPFHGFDLSGFDPADPRIEGLPPFDETLIDATVAARWTVFEGGARGARTSRAAALAGAAEAELAGARGALLSAVVGAYLDVVVARDVLAAHDRRLDAMAAERERVELALEEGAAARVDLARVDATVARARADRVDAAGALDVAAGDLVRLLDGDVDGSAVAAAVEAPRFDLDAGTGLDAADADAGRAPQAGRAPGAVGAPAPTDPPAGNPDVASARARARAAEAAEDAARAAWLPTLDAAGAYVERGSPGVGEWSGEWQAGLKLEYPLFTGGRRAAEVDRARAERATAAARLRAAELDAAGAAQRAATALARALARRDALVAAVAGFEEVARVEALALELGSGVQADWLDARADLLEARAALAEAEAAIVRAAVERARVAGELSIEWLASRLEEAP